MKKAFSLLELIFVIVILGIVSMVTSDIMINTFETYLIQKTKHSASEKTDIAAEQISNRLLYRVNLSLRGKKADGTSVSLGEIDPLRIDRDDFIGLEWISYDNDGFSSSNPPGWSGFIDLNKTVTNFNSALSTGSDFAFEKGVMEAKTGSSTNGAIIFIDTPSYRNDGNDIPYHTNCLYQANGCIFPVTLNGETLTFNGGDRVSGEMIYSEFYQLMSSAYTVMPEQNGDRFDLYLYSNYQPWLGETYLDGEKDIIMKNISVFRFVEEDNTVKIKICVDEKLKKKIISSCKEKAVIR